MRLSDLARKTNATLPRLSRVATSLERKGLIVRAACPEDGRAVNAVITSQGAEVREVAALLYAQAVRELVLDGLGGLEGDGVAQLTDLAYAVLKTMDPNVLAEASSANADAGVPCAADPEEPAAFTDPACPAYPLG